MSENAETCDTCLFWGRTSMHNEKISTSRMGCHRHAPTTAGTNDWKWPPTEKDDWCGDWALWAPKRDD